MSEQRSTEHLINLHKAMVANPTALDAMTCGLSDRSESEIVGAIGQATWSAAIARDTKPGWGLRRRVHKDLLAMALYVGAAGRQELTRRGWPEDAQRNAVAGAIAWATS